MTLDTIAVRNLILNASLLEESVTIPGWDKAADGSATNLIIRELDGKTGSDLIAACSDANGKPNQDALIAGVILATLRNGDDPQKALVFAVDPASQPNTYDPAYRDQLMSKGLGRIMQAATASIKLSGLDTAAATADAKNA